MLGGVDPIFIFQFYKLPPGAKSVLAKVPVLSSFPSLIDMPPIPLYLSEKLTGISIESEEKGIDIDTVPETKADGSDPDVNQKPLASTVSINMIASKNSIGLTLLMAMSDLIVPKVTSKEYAITYLHGPITVFGGLLHSFTVSQNSQNDLYSIKLELSKVNSKGTKPKGADIEVPLSDRTEVLSYEGPAPTVYWPTGEVVGSGAGQ